MYSLAESTIVESEPLSNDWDVNELEGQKLKLYLLCSFLYPPGYHWVYQDYIYYIDFVLIEVTSFETLL